MRITVNVNDFASEPRTMKPKVARLKAFRDPTVELTASGSTFALIDDFDESSSLPTEVLEPGALCRCLCNLLELHNSRLIDLPKERQDRVECRV